MNSFLRFPTLGEELALGGKKLKIELLEIS